MLVAWPSSRDELVAEPGCRPGSAVTKPNVCVTRTVCGFRASALMNHFLNREGTWADRSGDLSRVTQGQWVEGRLGSESRSLTHALCDPHTC